VFAYAIFHSMQEGDEKQNSSVSGREKNDNFSDILSHSKERKMLSRNGNLQEE
jgi:hypothetical protein